MLDSIFITVLVIAVILEIIAVYEESIIFTMLSLVFWITLYASSLGVEVPYIIGNENATGVVNITSGSHVYTDFGMSALCLAFIFINIMLALMHFLNYRKKQGLA